MTTISMKSMLLAVIVLAAGCGSTQQQVKQLDGDLFGAEIQQTSYESMGEVVKKLDGQESVSTTMRATVGEVCQTKGCWMTLHSTNAEEEAFFVKFKDYGFFVPKDISGRDVIVEGEAFIEETSVEELRHYAEDAGKSKEEIMQITEPEREMKFMASGVIVLPSD